MWKRQASGKYLASISKTVNSMISYPAWKRISKEIFIQYLVILRSSLVRSTGLLSALFHWGRPDFSLHGSRRSRA